MGQRFPSLRVVFILEQTLTSTDSTWNQILGKDDCIVPLLPETQGFSCVEVITVLLGDFFCGLAED